MITSRFCILALGMIVIVAVVLLRAKITNHQLVTDSLNTELQLAARTTVDELRHRTSQLLDDNVLEKNLRWQLPHTIKQTITQTMAGLEQVSVFDRQCRAIFGDGSSAFCQLARQGPATLTNYRSPHLIHSQTFAEGQYLLLTSLAIDSHWYSRQQRLQTLISQSPAVELVADQVGLDNLKFSYRQLHLNHFYRHAERYQQIASYTLWTMVTIWLLGLVSLLLTVRKKISTNSTDLSQLVRWSEQFDVGDDKMATVAGRTIVGNIVSKLQTQMDLLRGLRQQLTVKNSLLADFSNENHYLRDQLATTSFHHSLLSQASALNSQLLTSYDKISDNASDLRATIFAVYRSYLQPLTTLAEHWQGQICRRQLHRYLGVYHDNGQEKFFLQLQNDFQQMCALTLKVHDGLSNTLTFSRTLSTTSRNLVPVLSLWEKILLPHHRTTLVDLQSILARAQTLIRTINPQQTIVFTDQLVDGQLPANAELLVCGFYHLYRIFLVDDHDPQPLKLTTTCNWQERQLTVDLCGNRKLTDNDHRQFHFQQGQFILRKYNIRVSLSESRQTVTRLPNQSR